MQCCGNFRSFANVHHLTKDSASFPSSYVRPSSFITSTFCFCYAARTSTSSDHSQISVGSRILSRGNGDSWTRIAVKVVETLNAAALATWEFNSEVRAPRRWPFLLKFSDMAKTLHSRVRYFDLQHGRPTLGYGARVRLATDASRLARFCMWESDRCHCPSHGIRPLQLRLGAFGLRMSIGVPILSCAMHADPTYKRWVLCSLVPS